MNPEGLRIPIFLVWTGEDPPKALENRDIEAEIRERLCGTEKGSPSLWNYMDHLFSGRVQFPYPTDLINVRLPGPLEKYWIKMPSGGSHPRRAFFDDLKAWVEKDPAGDEGPGSRLKVRLDPFDKNGDGVIDMAIFLFVTDRQLAWPMRSWTEWTGPEGWTAPDNQGTVEFELPGTRKMKLSSYCAGRILAPPGSKVCGHGWIAHEIFHCFGLPDLYDAATTPPETAGCGSACMMGWGEYGLLENETGRPPPMFRKPVMPSAWCRKLLLDQVFGSRPTKRILPPRSGEKAKTDKVLGLTTPTIDPSSFVRVELSTKEGYDHYLMVELRAEANPERLRTYDWDKDFGKGGFLIWEIDESVGRQEGTKANRHWPMAFLKGIGPGAENRDKDRPLMALRVPGNRSTPRENLPLTCAWRPKYCWTGEDGSFEVDGVKLFDFDPERGEFSYIIQPLPRGKHAAGGEELAAAQKAAPVPERDPTPPVAIDVPIANLPQVTTIETGGEANLEKLSPEGQQRVGGVFRAYGEKEAVGLKEEPGAGISVTLPARTNFAFEDDLNSHLKLLGLNRAPGFRNSGLFAVIDDRKLAKLERDPKAELRDNLYLNLGTGEEIRVKDTYVVIRREGENGDKLHYEFTTGQEQEQKFKDLRAELLGGTKRLMEDYEFKNLVNKNMSAYLDLLKACKVEPDWKMVAERATGRVEWQFQIPTRKGDQPWIVKCDAVLTGGQKPTDVKLELE